MGGRLEFHTESSRHRLLLAGHRNWCNTYLAFALKLRIPERNVHLPLPGEPNTPPNFPPEAFAPNLIGCFLTAEVWARSLGVRYRSSYTCSVWTRYWASPQPWSQSASVNPIQCQTIKSGLLPVPKVIAGSAFSRTGKAFLLLQSGVGIHTPRADFSSRPHHGATGGQLPKILGQACRSRQRRAVPECPVPEFTRTK